MKYRAKKQRAEWTTKRSTEWSRDRLSDRAIEQASKRSSDRWRKSWTKKDWNYGVYFNQGGGGGILENRENLMGCEIRCFLKIFYNFFKCVMFCSPIFPNFASKRGTQLRVRAMDLCVNVHPFTYSVLSRGQCSCTLAMMHMVWPQYMCYGYGIWGVCAMAAAHMRLRAYDWKSLSWKSVFWEPHRPYIPNLSCSINPPSYIICEKSAQAKPSYAPLHDRQSLKLLPCIIEQTSTEINRRETKTSKCNFEHWIIEHLFFFWQYNYSTSL